jgi:glycosyltransferase involved in cell wall biosynthesis
MLHQNQSLPKPLISLCMIVRDEAQRLPRCLASAKPYVDEMVVVDTGSQDETVAIAEQYGATVSGFQWCDDFAAARNYSLSLATGQWILLLDADEELVVEDQNFRQYLTDDAPASVYALVRDDLYESDQIMGGAHLRLFRNQSGLHYVGSYHEQLQVAPPNQLIIQHLSGVKILHYGNQAEQVLEKAQHRDIPILEKMREAGDLDFWRLDCLARKYIKVGRADDAQACYAEALERLTPYVFSGEPPENFFWIPMLLDTLGSQALADEDIETARFLCQRGLEWCPNYPPLNYLAGELLVSLGFPLGAAAYFNACLQMGKDGTYYTGDPFPLSFVQTFPACGLGCVYQSLKQWQEAKSAFELALQFDPDYAPAKENLEKLSELAASD